ncbi:GDP-L-fucose synthase family protein [Sunxiuqinia elliptica]|uniref:GDP-L-fucose synthase n=1 Tax=Sunxiuqinia elliptica TaxID=655355 RepID=A0A4R6H490_9BACT|nr:GDP-L-fucose synthase [Sunxiuqinia elliptica]TDO02657.1 GDP-L-fucose synthase [Sunxiuqinia elliptica]TDO58605.1 GDP-L-fucose synthase [Sunxiuqinia elliptica]
MNKDSKIYIAGHRGLVGSALLNSLKKRGYQNFILKSHAELDLTDQQAVASFFEKEKPEYVFLAAAKVGGIMANNTYRGQFIYENLMIQNNVIHQAYQHQVKKLLFLGSTCIYPREAGQPMKENSLLTAPLEYTNEPYAIAKIAGIKLCESYNLQYGTNFIAVMPTNLYGPNDNFDLESSHVLPALIRKLLLGTYLETNNWEAIRDDLKKRPVRNVNPDQTVSQLEEALAGFGIRKNGGSAVEVEVWGSGKPKREFLWSEDMADACVFLMESKDFKEIAASNSESSEEVRNTHINIGTGQEVSIASLARAIQEEVGFQGKLVFNTSKPDGTMRKLTDPSKLHHLGWKHQIDIKEGISKICQWYTSTSV